MKTTVFIKNMNDFGAINAIYAQYFTEPFPARSCVEVARLPKDVLLECEVIAELRLCQGDAGFEHTLPPPMTEPLPMCTPGRMVTLPPIHTSSPMLTSMPYS